MVITREQIYIGGLGGQAVEQAATIWVLKELIQGLVLFGRIFQLWPLDRVNQWLTFKVILLLSNGIGTWRDLVDFISLNNIKYYECRRSTARFVAPSRSSGIYVLPLFRVRHELCSSFCRHAGHLYASILKIILYASMTRGKSSIKVACHARKWRYAVRKWVMHFDGTYSLRS